MERDTKGRLREARYALQCFESDNLGGEVQSVAAMQFLPSIDLLVERDHLGRSSASIAEPHKIILNGWFTDRPEDWPPAAFLQPLITSFHLSRQVSDRNRGGLVPAKVLLQGENLEYLIQHEPIGARDFSSRELLLEAGVDAYFSGCLSLTLGDGAPVERGDYVCAVDLPARLLGLLRSQVKGLLVEGTHEESSLRPFGERAHLARRMLSRYAHAKCVVTTRLHCALPCLAFGTPVLFIMSAKDKYRFSGLSDLMNICLPQAFLEGKAGFNPNRPPPNADNFLELRKDLISHVNQFVGAAPTASPTAPFPFIPEPLTDALLAADRTHSTDQTESDPTSSAFHRLFVLGRNYDGEARPDFLRDVGRVHAAGGDMDEAARLLEIASRERPHGIQITKLLEQFKAKRPEASAIDPASQQPQTELTPLAHDVLARRLTSLSPQQLSGFAREVSQAKIRGAEGDFVECGVHLGGTAVCIASQLDGARRFLGFDLFLQRSRSSETDDAPLGESPRDTAAANLASFGLRVDGRRIRLAAGAFKSTLPKGLPASVAFAHINCDQDSQIALCLDGIGGRLSRFGAIIVGGYDEDDGRRKVVDAFLLGRNDIFLASTAPNAVLIKL